MNDPIEEIKQKLSIVEVIQEYIPQLKKVGRNFRGLCPFHTEKTPSFYVNTELNRFKCFGCGVSGDIFNFVMDIDHLDFPEALENLAGKAGVTIEKQNFTPRQRDKKQSIYAINEKVAEFYNKLLSSQQGQVGLEYLKGRKNTDESIATFKLGFAPATWDELAKFLIVEKENIGLAVEIGLIMQKLDRTYDRFRGRVMFPIYDGQGNCVGFSGRILDQFKDPKFHEGKYINSPQSIVYDKSSLLYGIHLAKPAIIEQDEVILVEGNVDVVMLHQVGVKHVVAPLGTSLTQKHLHSIKKLTTNITLAFDGDEAGQKAIMRAVTLCQEEEIIPQAIVLPENEDVASLLEQRQTWEEIKENKQDGYEFALRFIINSHDLTQPSQKQEASKDVVDFLRNIPHAPTREQYTKKASYLLKSSEESISLALRKKGKTFKVQSKKKDDNEKKLSVDKKEILFLQSILFEKKLFDLIHDKFDVEDLENQKVQKLYLFLQNCKEYTIPFLQENLPEDLKKILEYVVFQQEKEEELDGEKKQELFLELATSLKKKQLQKQLAQIKYDLEKEKDAEKASLLLQNMLKLKKVLENIKIGGIIVYGQK